MLVGNAIGAFALGIICHSLFGGVTEIAYRISVIAENKIDYARHSVLLEGIFCGALVYIAVYFFKNLQNYAMKIIGIITAVTLFVFCGFQHCIANMFYFAMNFDWVHWEIDYLWNILIVILLNSIGALLVRCLVHLAAIISAPSKKEENEEK